jgi:hypothetical protein
MGFEEDNGYGRYQMHRNGDEANANFYDDCEVRREMELEREEERLDSLGIFDDEPEDLPYDDFPEWIPEDDTVLIPRVTLNGIPVSEDFDPLEEEDDEDEEDIKDDGILEDDDEKFYE